MDCVLLSKRLSKVKLRMRKKRSIQKLEKKKCE